MSYYKNKDCSDFTGDGWFDTGDISTSGENGYMHIVDGAKNVIKLGGR
jgi:fatty-acyl-CoA synthase